MEIGLFVLGLVLFVALVVVHEWGHFIMARRNGVDVEEFGLGFPPKIATFYKDKKGTEYTVNLLPLGGFVRLKGEHDADRQKGAFGSVSFWAKTKIILAGVFMNLFTAWVMLSVLAFVGIPKLPLPGGEEQFTVARDTRVVSNKVFVGYVEPGGPADKAGLKVGDQLISIKPASESSQEFAYVESASDLRSITEDFLTAGNSSLNTLVIRDGESTILTVEPRTVGEVEASQNSETPKGYFGVIPQDFTIQRSSWSAPIVGAGLVVQYSKITYQALGDMVVNLFLGNGKKATENVSGIVGIGFTLDRVSSLGLSYVLLIIAVISLSLAIMNTLPIPALDGGKLAVMALFRVIKRPLTPRIEERIHGTGFALLMVAFILITIVDVQRFFLN